MASENLLQIAETLRKQAETVDDADLRAALRWLGDGIKTGNIRNSTGVAIGPNPTIRQIINQFNVPPEAAATLLNLRAFLVPALGLDTERYQWGAIIADRTRNFVGRDYVFQAIDRFLRSHSSGYFIIEGDPGLGKSAILAEYVRRTGCIVHFNVRALGITSAAHFIQAVCGQIIADAQLPYSSLPVDATKDGAFFSRLLQEAARQLGTADRLVIAVDALDEVDSTGQPPGANLLFLPHTVPDGVYFVLTQRHVDVPFVTQAPLERLDLLTHPAENRCDVETYLERAVERLVLRGWIDRQPITVASFVTQLANLSENNFMYLRYVLEELANPQGMYQHLRIERLPFGLAGYYADHWRHMGMASAPLPRVKIRIVYILSEVRQPVSRRLISEFATDPLTQVDEFSVQEVLDAWKQFLHEQPDPEGIRYSVYHASFRDFLNRKDIVQAAGVTIKDINALIADTLWNDLFGSN